MNLIKRIFPNSIKQEGRYLLYKLLKIPYNKVELPVDITEWLSCDKPITFLDVGANKGDFSAALIKHYQVTKGILIEPIPARIAALKTRFSDTSRYEIVNMAISDKTGEADFYISEDLDVLSSLLKINDEHLDPFAIAAPVKTIVKTETLDNIHKHYNLGIIDLIKVDVQGAEHFVLSASVEALKSTRFLYTEFSYKPMYHGSSTFFDVFKIMTDNNFRMVGTSSAYKLQNGEIVQGDALFVNNGLG